MLIVKSRQRGRAVQDKNKSVHDKCFSGDYDDTKQFKSDIENEFGVEDHPKKDLLFSISWERGHSAGYYEVYYCYQELVELIK